MKDGLRRWWPALPAALILYLGGASFAGKFPHSVERKAERSMRSGGPDSLLAFVRKGTAPSAPGDTGGALDNPFRPVHAPRPEGGRAQAYQPDPPPRRYVLKGTVGTNVATVANNAGQKLIVKVGDIIDSAQVVAIETNKVTLKDRGGKFDLILQR